MMALSNGLLSNKLATFDSAIEEQQMDSEHIVNDKVTHKIIKHQQLRLIKLKFIGNFFSKCINKFGLSGKINWLLQAEAKMKAVLHTMYEKTRIKNYKKLFAQFAQI